MVAFKRDGIVFLSILMLSFLSGCSTVRDKLSVQKEAPDEFAAAPPACTDLSIPPSIDVLPKPQTCGENADPFPQKNPGTSSNSTLKTAGQKAFSETLKKQNRP